MERGTMAHKVILSLLILGMGASACNLPVVPESEPGVQSAARSWFDAPLPRTVHAPPNPCRIVAHGASPAGIARFELSVNGQVIADIPSPDMQASLVTLTRDCDLSAPGMYVLRLRAQDNAGAWSTAAETSLIIESQPPPEITASSTPAPEATPTWTPTPACIDRAGFVADVTIPDDTSLAPGAFFTKTWRLRNDGNCPWDESYKVVFVSGDPMENPTPVSIAGVIAPGGTVDISLPLRAPASPGSYRGNYQLRNPQGVHFGVGGEPPRSMYR
jgi:hypothetical protein